MLGVFENCQERLVAMCFACWITKAGIQKHAQNMWYLLLFHGRNGYANSPQYCNDTYIACRVKMIFVSHQLENMWKHPNPFEGNNFLELVKMHQKHVGISCLQAEFRNRDHRNTKQEWQPLDTDVRFGVVYDSLRSWISELFVCVVSFTC